MTTPAELVDRLVAAMVPLRVCLTCGEPSRRLFTKQQTWGRQAELAAHIKERRQALGITSSEINGWFGYKEIAKNWERTDPFGAAVPNPHDWPLLKERLGLSDDFDSFITERRDSLIEYEANGETLDREDRRTDYGRGGDPEAWGESRVKANRRLPETWTDCGHDNWRPGVALLIGEVDP